jgi:hypothetical protein
MNLSDKFRRFAAECEAMFSFAESPGEQSYVGRNGSKMDSVR